MKSTTPNNDLDGYSPGDLRRANKLRDAIMALKYTRHGEKQRVTRKICDEFGLSKNKLRRYRNDYEKTGSLTVFLRKPRGDKNETRSTSPEIQEILIEEYIQFRNKTDAYAKAKTETIANRWKIGSYGSICRWLTEHVDKNKTLSLYINKGRKGLENEVAPSILRDFSNLECNEFICGDHHQFDLFIAEGQYVYRPWITAWQDLKTRAISGYTVCYLPNSRTIAQALRNTIRDTDSYQTLDSNLRYCGRYHGVPQKAYIDNGKDYRSHYISGDRWQKKKLGRIDFDIMSKAVMAELGIEPVYCLPYNAKAKPIERWFNTLENQFIKRLPGYCGNAPQNRPVHELTQTIKSRKLLTLDEFRVLLDEYIERKYHKAEHRGRGMKGRSPNQVWDNAIKNGWTPVTIDDDAILRHLFMMNKERTVSRFGVQIHNEFYYHAALFFYIKKRVEVRWDPADLSEVHIYHENMYICTAFPYPYASMKIPHEELGERLRQKRAMIKIVEDQYRYLTGGKAKPDNTKGAGNLSKAIRKYGDAAAEEERQKQDEQIIDPGDNLDDLVLEPPPWWEGELAKKEKSADEIDVFALLDKNLNKEQ